MSSPRKPLYQRLPEIYRIKDAEQIPTGQLAAYLGILDEVPAALRDDIEKLYADFFIETCADWVIPYLADLLGTSHLAGDPWSLRADVARTVFHRRRKGTLGAIESLAFTLSGWAAQAVELRNNLVWTQHINHQRPDAGGTPPLLQRASLAAAVRGGTLPVRDPATLSLLNGPFDPFAHVADFKPREIGAARYNLPNLGIFLWRLEDYSVQVADPGALVSADVSGPLAPDDASAVVRCTLHPQADPMVLFNSHRYRMGDDPPNLSHPDEVPGPMPWPRLTSGAELGNPAAYVRVAYYQGTVPDAPGAGAPGLVLHLPDGVRPPTPPGMDPAQRWRFRGANLCAWEAGLSPALGEYEIAIDPARGRVLFGLSDRITEADPLADALLVSYTYGFAGPTGAHPVLRAPLDEVTPLTRSSGPDPLETALADLHAGTTPLVLEIQDSATYDLDLGLVSGVENDGGILSLLLAQPLTIRAAAGQRPVIRLIRPLRFRPAPGALQDALSVTLEGLYVTWDRAAADFAAAAALIARAAVDLLRIEGCTLDPGGAWQLDGTARGAVQDPRPGLALSGDYDLNAADLAGFDQIPRIDLHRSISGAVLAEENAYVLSATDSIIDAGSGVGDPAPIPAIGSPSDPVKGWGPALEARGLTCLGTVRVAAIGGPDGICEGGVFLHALQVHDNQKGCVKLSFLSGVGDRLPPHQGCVFGTGAQIALSDLRFGMPGYARLSRRCDPRILEQGPGRDQMGAFGYLQNTHKWKNIDIRFREFMPVGVCPVLIPVT